MKALAIKTTISWILVALALIVLIFGCRSVKTNKSVTIATHDSTAIEKTDSSGIKKTNVVKLVTEDKNTKSEIEITFESDYPAAEKDYWYIDTPRVKKPPVVINNDGTIILHTTPKSIKKTDTDKGKIIESTVINKSDTSNKTVEKKTSVNDTQTEKTVSKKKTGTGTGFTISIILFSLVILLYLLWRLKKHLTTKPETHNP